MRPVDRGYTPRIYLKYQDAITDLVERMGAYCSYCERRIDNAPEVEHVEPKDLNLNLELVWSNFLISCKTCNTVKSNKPVDRTQITLPDQDNPMCALVYTEGKVQAHMGLSLAEREKIRRLLDLVGLDRHPDSVEKPTKRDTRWMRRLEVTEVARDMKSDLATEEAEVGEHPILRNNAIHVAIGYGFFSVWMSEFKNDVDMRRRLIAAFPGTVTRCFDANGEPLPR